MTLSKQPKNKTLNSENFYFLNAQTESKILLCLNRPHLNRETPKLENVLGFSVTFLALKLDLKESFVHGNTSTRPNQKK